MSASAKLIGIKLLHTVIWVVLSAVIYYLLYAVITDRIDRWFWWGLGLVGLEIATLVVFRMNCPLTVVAAVTPLRNAPTSTSTCPSGSPATTRPSAR